MNKYISDLQTAIKRLHECDSSHIESVPVIETFQGKVVWQGQVEVFSLTGHPKAKRCYAWSHVQDDKQQRYIAVLELPPVKTALDAVRASIVSQSK